MKAAKPVMRKIRRHYGVSARRVAVKSQRPWYWRLLVAIIFMSLGYGICYWQLVKGGFGNSVEAVVQQNRLLLAKVSQSELLLQLEHAAQDTLMKELASLQEEDMRLKEDVAFYKSILSETTTSAGLKLHSFKISKGAQPNQYEYHIMLMQTGRSSKTVQGTLSLSLIGTQNGNPVTLSLNDNASAGQAISINFKYYQRVDGSFNLPNGVVGHTVAASFFETGASQPRLSQKVDLPN